MSQNGSSLRKTLSDIIRVSGSNMVKLLSGVLVGFLLPKIVGVTDYGYFKTFTLYVLYVGLFHFGIVDGIHLKYGGWDYQDLDRHSFRFYTAALFMIEVVIGAVICAVAMLFLTGEYRFIFFCLGIYLIVHNVTGYFQSISQVTSRFRELSQRTVIQSVLMALAVALLWISPKIAPVQISYRIYTVFYVLIEAFLAVWYVFTYRDITFRKRTQLWSDIPKLIKLGFPLTVANLCASLVLTLDRQFVNILFDTNTYAVYAFAYNMLALVTTATAAIATVLYPSLKKAKEESLPRNYPRLISAVLAFAFGCLVLYFPLCAFVEWFLPKFTGSLPIYRIIFPGLAVSSAISIVMYNYYKTLDLSFLYFKKSVVVLVISGIANYVAYYFFHTPAAISVASIVVMLIWYMYVEAALVKKYQVARWKNVAYMILLMTAFYVITAIPNLWIAGAVYVAVFLAASFFLIWKDVKRFILE